MKLSEAIRLGAMTGPQTFGPSGLCAGNAALAAIGVDYSDNNACGGTYGTLSNAWPWLRKSGVCPVCAREVSYEYLVILCLNDRHEWAREQIADWVEQIERQQEAKAPEAEKETASQL